MPRSVTSEQVHRAADSIQQSGETPTVEKIRKKLGTGTHSTIGRMLKTWRHQQVSGLRDLKTIYHDLAHVEQELVAMRRITVDLPIQGHAQVPARRPAGSSSVDVGAILSAQQASFIELQLTDIASIRNRTKRAYALIEAQLNRNQLRKAYFVNQLEELFQRCGQHTDLINDLRKQLELIS